MAHTLCFSSYSHFSASFKQTTGLTPKVYREQNRIVGGVLFKVL
ncbi:AraC family transcriptional regulator [Paenibacillus vini]